MGKFHVEHFGCRAARADGEAVTSRLRAAGLDEGQAAAADVVVVNTCSVTAEADRAARAFIRRTHRQNPKARIVVTGCYAQRAPEELAELAGVAAVVGNNPLPRTEIVSKLWAYIKKNKLQDQANKRMVNADDKLRTLFGKGQVSMFEMAGLIGKHVK